MNQKGQALLIILLATLVALSIALSLTQRSQSDLASSNRGDQASRALAAAEAGIEKALVDTAPIDSTNYIDAATLNNQSSVSVKSTGLVPTAADQSLEYPAIDKTTFAQYWLTGYTGSSFDIYFGNPADHTAGCNNACPGIAVTLIVDSGGVYQFINRQFDSYTTRNPSPNFGTTTTCSSAGMTVNNVFSISSSGFAQPTSVNYYCRATFTITTGTPILVRIRSLFTDKALVTALVPSSNRSLPPQAVYYSATGTAGQSKRTVRLFTQKDVVPFFFDYAIFSNGDINK
jgi:hypothetical protein